MAVGVSLLMAGSCGRGLCVPGVCVTVLAPELLPGKGMAGKGPLPATVVCGGGGRGGGGIGEGVLPPTRTVTVLPPVVPLVLPALTFTTGKKTQKYIIYSTTQTKI